MFYISRLYMELTDDMIRWIEAHSKDDTSRLRFRYSDDPVARFCILQIETRRHAAKKLPHTLQCSSFQFPTALSAEQCTSDGLAEFHASLVSVDERILDMTAGLGIDAFHIARRKAQVTAIDIDPDVAEALAHNAKALGLRIETICTDSVSYLHDSNRCFDTVFIDPARRGDGGKRLFALSDCAPDIVSLMPLLRKRCGRLIVKASPMIDIEQTLRTIPEATRLYVTGTRHECKELVIICDFRTPASDSQTQITPLTILADGTTHSFTFTQQQERSCTVATNDPLPGQILYEPYPAAMKSGAYRFLSANYGCYKLHPNTHLYISDRIIPDFPGTPYTIESLVPFSSKDVKQIKKHLTSGSVAVRNFVMTAEELKRKLKLKEDSQRRIIGTTTLSGKILIAVRPFREPD